MNKVVVIECKSVLDLNLEIQKLNEQGWIVIDTLAYSESRKGIRAVLLLARRAKKSRGNLNE